MPQEVINVIVIATLIVSFVLLIGFASKSDVFKDGLILAIDAMAEVVPLFVYRQVDRSRPEINNLKFQIENLRDEMHKRATGNIQDDLGEELDAYVSAHLDEVIAQNLNSSRVESTVIQDLRRTVTEETQNYLEGIPQEKLVEASLELVGSEEKAKTADELAANIEREAASSSMLKMVMINLFVVATLAFLMFNILGPELSANGYLGSVGIYISLGAFMLYIIRTSHFRTNILLAIKEQQANYQNALQYLRSRSEDSVVSEHDVEIVRMLLVNRTEREHRADHPYEVILKGVSGSNIQFKGGKMSLGESKK